MGYYTGNGVITNGSKSYRTLRSFAVYGGGSFSLRQLSQITVNVKNGVSLTDAQGANASQDLHYTYGGQGDKAWIVFDTHGTKISVSFSRIGDSNLYTLQTTTEVTTVATVSGE